MSRSVQVVSFVTFTQFGVSTFSVLSVILKTTFIWISTLIDNASLAVCLAVFKPSFYFVTLESNFNSFSLSYVCVNSPKSICKQFFTTVQDTCCRPLVRPYFCIQLDRHRDQCHSPRLQVVAKFPKLVLKCCLHSQEENETKVLISRRFLESPLLSLA